MSISGHKTPSTFGRCDIVCNDDKGVALAALERAQRRSRTARAANPLRAPPAEGRSHKAAIVAPAQSDRVQ
jgi:hypothetical protein